MDQTASLLLSERLKARVIGILLLIITSLLLFHYFDRYEVTSVELIHNGMFSQGAQHWQYVNQPDAIDPDGTASLYRDSTGFSSMYQVIARPLNMGPFRLSGELASEQLVAGKEPWQQGKLLLQELDKSGQVISNQQVIGIQHTRSWQYYEKVMTLQPDTKSIRISFEMLDSQGLLKARNIRFHSVRETASYQYLYSAALAIWCLAAIWVLIPLRHLMRSKASHIAAVGTLIVAAFGVLMPYHLKMRLLASIEQHLLPTGGLDSIFIAIAPTIALQDWLLTHIDLTKIGHFFIFALITICLYWASNTKRWSPILVGMLTLAASSEVLQIFVNNRTPRLTDFAIDAAGIFFGLILAQMFSMVLKRR